MWLKNATSHVLQDVPRHVRVDWKFEGEFGSHNQSLRPPVVPSEKVGLGWVPGGSSPVIPSEEV